MSQILPFRSEVEVSREAPKVVDLQGEESEAIFSALASETSRAIYRSLYDEPATASDLAERVDTSVQNVRYHLEKLQNAGLIDDVDTWYSSRGNEMTVYAATNEALIVAGDKYQQSELRSLFKSSAGAFGLLVGFSAIVHVLTLEHFTQEAFLPGTHDGSGVAPQDVQSVEALLVEPGALVFLGGLVLLAVYVAWSYRSIKGRNLEP